MNKIKGITWAIFAGTATLCAFLLPVFILKIILHKPIYSPGPSWLVEALSVIIIFSALYHSIYRIIASNHDLKLFKALLFWMVMIGIFIFTSEIIQLI